LMLPERTVIAGPSAAYLAGLAHVARFDSPVYVNLPRGAKAVAPLLGIKFHKRTLSPDEIVDDALPRSVPARAAWEVGAWLPLPEALAIIDAMLNRGLVTPADLAAVPETTSRDDGRAAVRALALAEGCVASVAESYLRGLVLVHGFPRPVLGHRIAVAGAAELEPRMTWPVQRVAFVADGEWPGAYVRAGWRVVSASSEQMRGDLLGVANRIGAALLRSGWRREVSA
jgi:hypothetical protein